MPSSAPRLLDQLASLTSIRDLELIEFSLLKTLKGFLQPQHLSMMRLNARGQPCLEIVYGDDRCSVLYENLALTPALEQADHHLSTTDAPYFMTRVGRWIVVVFALAATRSGRNYLQIQLDRELSRQDMHLMAGVLQIYRNFVSLMQHSQTDQLTGLANRKTFDECVAKVHELMPVDATPVAIERRGQRSEVHFWLVMVDIDHFKQVNDRFGHLYGDEVLVLLAQLMQSAFREDDMVFRFGGEEFVLIIRCADLAACHTTLERFRQRVENQLIPQVGHITVSMGVTRMQRQLFTTSMVDQADQALYFSKRNGRNQINFYEQLVEQGLIQVETIETSEISYF